MKKTVLKYKKKRLTISSSLKIQKADSRTGKRLSSKQNEIARINHKPFPTPALSGSGAKGALSAALLHGAPTVNENIQTQKL